MPLKILTFNIHKGFNWNNTKYTLKRLKKALTHIHPDIVFLQEVVGENKKHQKKFDKWIDRQFEYLAQDLWSDFSYSNHAVFDFRNHGNVILSKYPILNTEVQDISTNHYEQRALLFSEIQIEDKILHTYCVHLNLLHKDRIKQYEYIKDFVQSKSDNHHPILIAGDFNDWNQKASEHFLNIDNLYDAHKFKHGFYGRTFPTLFPLLKLDRIYTKGFHILDAEVFKNKHWKSLSDHLPIYIEVEFK
ncbi:MAG: endonuclease/exonuclease/phosphatase family protein [Bacteriovoracaceae bacterium]|jgi:endonuclease/exonuclease/phosphatase family metal-dependent hydrolase|nr:hypothetical protein [Halobacteriovoraceae bacterium]MDP7320628.1 endonuclease/exonuclease/phosphatase family protein [Bacteriovoracaceae bacterium]